MAHPGTLHRYNNRLVAFEHASPHAPSSTEQSIHTILWLGGLTDGLLTVHYPATIAKSLPPTWRIAEVLISSSYKGFATGSLTRDARELAACVKYFQQLRGKDETKIVVMGHSTGCQDAMELCVGSGKEQVQLAGVILQGGVSDREAFTDIATRNGMKAEFNAIVEKAEKLVAEGKGSQIMQKEGNPVAEMLGSPMTAYRTSSLLSLGGDDDYFSSDLSDQALELTFGKWPEETPLCFLLGEEDPYVPASVVKQDLLDRWTKVVRKHGGTVDDVHGGLVKGAKHNLNDNPKEAVDELVRRVVGFVNGVESESIPGARL
ncbi:DUF1749-domain-containing protein [Pleomassaria siparia CBS 279.74]|uniref:DUF1749-domain-containing protein n=1 Tax=Pleomassaria siparia CBS 279.74 TaxID=1314801 RepID=A0A6G1KBW7_9PLEO|nr:DUF1749-domain-containing protein [Pleomassaria siparia CBS 279.74]